MTTTAEHCIAAMGSNAYRHKRSCHDLIILYYQHASMRLSKVAVVVSNLLLYCTSEWMALLSMFIAPTATTMIGSGLPGVN